MEDDQDDQEKDEDNLQTWVGEVDLGGDPIFSFSDMQII